MGCTECLARPEFRQRPPLMITSRVGFFRRMRQKLSSRKSLHQRRQLFRTSPIAFLRIEKRQKRKAMFTRDPTRPKRQHMDRKIGCRHEPPIERNADLPNIFATHFICDRVQHVWKHMHMVVSVDILRGKAHSAHRMHLTAKRRFNICRRKRPKGLAGQKPSFFLIML